MTARSWRLLAADRNSHGTATAQLLVNFIAGRRSFVNNKINVKSCFVGPENINSGASTRGGCRGGQTITVAARVTPACTERASDVRRAVTNRPLAVFEKAWNNATDVMVFTCCCFDHLLLRQRSGDRAGRDLSEAGGMRAEVLVFYGFCFSNTYNFQVDNQSKDVITRDRITNHIHRLLGCSSVRNATQMLPNSEKNRSLSGIDYCRVAPATDVTIDV